MVRAEALRMLLEGWLHLGIVLILRGPVLLAVDLGGITGLLIRSTVIVTGKRLLLNSLI